MQNHCSPAGSGPFGGVPPFDEAKVEHFKPALDEGMAAQLAENRTHREARLPRPHFENTIAALERSGSDTRPRAARVQRLSRPRCFRTRSRPCSAKWNRSLLRSRIASSRTKALQADQRGLRSARALRLSPEQQAPRVWLKYTNSRAAARKLGAAAKQRLSAINQRLASLYTEFSQNVLADEASYVLIDNEEDLAGLPESLRSAAAEAAGVNGRSGRWAILNTRSSVEPFLTYSTKRGLREKVWRAFINRGDNGDAHDNKRVIAEIVELRDERARLLGYPTHAHWRPGTQHGEDAGARYRADAGRVEAGGAARDRGSRRHAGQSPTRRVRASRSSPGTIATTQRKSAKRSTTSTTTKSRHTCSSRTSARRCSGWPASWWDCVSRRRRTFRYAIRTCAYGR
jgi:peptidyl-dipeptidase Dcp